MEYELTSHRYPPPYLLSTTINSEYELIGPNLDLEVVAHNAFLYCTQDDHNVDVDIRASSKLGKVVSIIIHGTTWKSMNKVNADVV